MFDSYEAARRSEKARRLAAVMRELGMSPERARAAGDRTRREVATAAGVSYPGRSWGQAAAMLELGMAPGVTVLLRAAPCVAATVAS